MISKLLSENLSIIPVGKDKRPKIDWKPFMSTLPSVSEIGDHSEYMAVVGGAVSGGLICIDFDDAGSCFSDYVEIIKNYDFYKRLVIQKTPSGGYHIVFKSSIEVGNKKLAMRVNQDNTQAVLIETRGEGGYFLIDPSPGYKLIQNNWFKIPFLLNSDAKLLLTVAKGFDKRAQREVLPNKPIANSYIGSTPFDDYDLKENPLELLKNHGWTIVYERNGAFFLRRPGKKQGVSASWNYIQNRFYCFTTSTQFENESIYKASAVYAVLEHNGDFVAAAKDLNQRGYGQKKLDEKPLDLDTTPTTSLLKCSDFKEDIYKFYKSDFEKGLRLGLPTFDKHIRFEKRYLNIITGIPTHGKSEFMDFLSYLLALNHGWKFVVFSPENFPIEVHFNKIAQKFQKMNMFNRDRSLIDKSIEFLDNHFRFINATENEINLEKILSSALTYKADALIIDPWNEIENSRPSKVSESDYIGDCLRKLRKYARKNNMAVFVVTHPMKMKKNKDGGYDVPSLYDISGSANWYNKADNALVVQRDFDNNITEIHIKKVKYRNYGSIGTVEFQFDKNTGHFIEVLGF